MPTPRILFNIPGAPVLQTMNISFQEPLAHLPPNRDFSRDGNDDTLTHRQATDFAESFVYRNTLE